MFFLFRVFFVVRCFLAFMPQTASLVFGTHLMNTCLASVVKLAVPLTKWVHIVVMLMS